MTHWESHGSQQEQEAAGIRNMVDLGWPSVVSNNQEKMKMLLQYHQYLCLEEMAYRGPNKTTESHDCGEWKEFINLMLRRDPLFKKYHYKMKQRHRMCHCMSNRSSNELFKSIAFGVRRTIKEKIDEASMYSMLIDGCKDNAGHEELALCFRFVNDSEEIEERFYKLARLKETDAATIVDTGMLPALNPKKPKCGTFFSVKDFF